MRDQFENRRKKLIFRSWHRGTREMDLILGPFADRTVPDLDAGGLDFYEDLLERSDPDLYNLVASGQGGDDNNPLLRRLQDHYRLDIKKQAI